MRTTSPSARPHVSTVDRRNRTRPRADRTLRARADAAIINQWLFEQSDRPAGPTAPKRPAAA